MNIGLYSIKSLYSNNVPSQNIKEQPSALKFNNLKMDKVELSFKSEIKPRINSKLVGDILEEIGNTAEDSGICGTSSLKADPGIITIAKNKRDELLISLVNVCDNRGTFARPNDDDIDGQTFKTLNFVISKDGEIIAADFIKQLGDKSLDLLAKPKDISNEDFQKRINNATNVLSKYLETTIDTLKGEKIMTFESIKWSKEDSMEYPLENDSNVDLLRKYDC
ncbi:MAG: hypothetical protein WCK67_08850 [bacterium]